MARIAELEARLSAPPKTPDNSSTPPSKGDKTNLPDRLRKRRRGRPGVSRVLAEHPDRIIESALTTCPHCAYVLRSADQRDIHAYDHIELPTISPTVTRINRHRGVCPCCRKLRDATYAIDEGDEGFALGFRFLLWRAGAIGPRRDAPRAGAPGYRQVMLRFSHGGRPPKSGGAAPPKPPHYNR